MSQSAPEFNERLARFLDGQMSGEEKESFAREMALDADLRRAVEMQRRIDAGLRRIFSPTIPALSSSFADVTEARPGPSRRLWTWMAAAAVLALCAAGSAWWGYASFMHPRQGPLYDLYASEVKSGFVPQIECTTDLEFRRFTFYALNQTIHVGPASAAGAPKVDVIGWSYRPAVTASSPVLLARVDGREVVVVMDKTADCAAPIPSPAAPEKNTVHVFRKRIGTACLYELSTLDKAALLDALEATDPPP